MSFLREFLEFLSGRRNANRFHYEKEGLKMKIEKNEKNEKKVVNGDNKNVF